MNEKITITLPKLGESILRATVVQWFKEEGDYIQLDEPLLEVSTDKVNSEIPSSCSGYIEAILTKPFMEIDVGEPLCIIRVEKKAIENANKKNIILDPPEISRAPSNFASPVVLQMARENNLDLKTLQEIKGTGAGGRISKKDIQQYLSIQTASCVKPKGIPLSERRQTIARNLLDSYTKIPHASLIREIDVTQLLHYIQDNKNQFYENYRSKLTITSFIIQAIANTVQNYPLINASLNGNMVTIHPAVNLGIAVNINDDLIVPVIKNCSKLRLCEIAGKVADFATRARNNQIVLSEMQEGTLTLTNFGMGGAEIGVPIIRYPEAAIIGMGAITKRVVALSNSSIGIAEIMYISLTFDHRIIDGMYASRFLQELKTYIETLENIHKSLPDSCLAR